MCFLLNYKNDNLTFAAASDQFNFGHKNGLLKPKVSYVSPYLHLVTNYGSNVWVQEHFFQCFWLLMLTKAFYVIKKMINSNIFKYYNLK